MHLGIEIGGGFSDAALSKYHQHLHLNVYPPADISWVREVAADGHEKLRSKRHGGTVKAATKLGKFGARHNHGWFMVVDPVSQHVLSVEEQVQSEGNDVVQKSLDAILPMYCNLDTLVMDRACSFMPSARENKKNTQLKNYIADLFHAKSHVKKCPCNPCPTQPLLEMCATIPTCCGSRSRLPGASQGSKEPDPTHFSSDTSEVALAEAQEASQGREHLRGGAALQLVPGLREISQ